MDITQLVRAQRDFFATGATLDIGFRKKALSDLYNVLTAREDEINRALLADLNKSPFETYMTETGMVLAEISHLRKHLARWAKPHTVPTPLAQFPSRSFELHEPYGCVLIMAPWNYPLQLALEPLAGAIAAGNTAIIKPSAYAPATSHVLADILGQLFDPAFVAVVEGGREENQALLEQTFDYIFFTGGVATGKVVMEAASRHLTPVTLELGGKSPCIIDETADLKVAARRLAFGKFLNAGQTCVAPDYLLVHRSVKDRVVELLGKEITAFFGPDPLACDNLPKIVNEKHFRRVCGLLSGEKILLGGQSRDGRIAPTVLEVTDPSCPIMQEEIFGPVLPVLVYDDLQEVLDFVSARPKPLALYLFTKNKATEDTVLGRLSFGGGCVNDTIIHLATSHMGFGGVGASGMGSYHGKRSFDTFTHTKSIVKKATWLDLPMRYHPYKALNEKLLRIFLR
jgi:aldehyde dehydrogenase (NAD+)